MVPRYQTKKYEEHLNSPKWKEIREKTIQSTYQEVPNHEPDRGHFHCEYCRWNFHKHELEVHHLNYNSLGNERRIDLAVVCSSCHDILDEIRAKKGREKSSEALENARFYGWAKAVHGENWDQYLDQSEVYDDFVDWLEDQTEEW